MQKERSSEQEVPHETGLPDLSKPFLRFIEKERRSLSVDGLFSALKEILKNFESETGVSIVLPKISAICEIGGPSPETIPDILSSATERLVLVNSGFGSGNSFRPALMGDSRLVADLSELSPENRLRANPNFGSPVKLSLAIDDKTTPEKILASEGKFDFISSYRVFGTEGESVLQFGVTGVDLRTRRKRVCVLRNLSQLLQPNGLLMIQTLNDQIGFKSDELEEAGFRVLASNNDGRPRGFLKSGFYYFFQFDPSLVKPEQVFDTLNFEQGVEDLIDKIDSCSISSVPDSLREQYRRLRECASILNGLSAEETLRIIEEKVSEIFEKIKAGEIVKPPEDFLHYLPHLLLMAFNNSDGEAMKKIIDLAFELPEIKYKQEILKRFMF